MQQLMLIAPYLFISPPNASGLTCFTADVLFFIYFATISLRCVGRSAWNFA